MDTGIIATTIAHDSFKKYMYGSLNGPTSLVGAVVSVYYAGKCIGALVTGNLCNAIGRKRSIAFWALVAVVGSAIQAGSVHIAMMIVGRLIAGFATGGLMTAVPVYISEISLPEKRGFLGNFQGTLVATGFAVANWVGYAGAFADGNAQWRIPLAMQIPVTAALFALTFIIPFSPRWRACLSPPDIEFCSICP
jgi:MFS family permease